MMDAATILVVLGLVAAFFGGRRYEAEQWVRGMRIYKRTTFVVNPVHVHVGYTSEAWEPEAKPERKH